MTQFISDPTLLAWVQNINYQSLQDAVNAVASDGSVLPDTVSKKNTDVRPEDILALMPPPPMLSLAQLQFLASNFSTNFGINRAALNTGISPTESAIALAAATSWAKNETAQKELVQEIIKTENKNPIESALLQYVTNSQATGFDIASLQTILKTSPSLSTLFHTIDPTLTVKAYQIAEQQIILTMLDTWVEMEGQRADKARAQAKIDDIKADQIVKNMIQEYIQETTLKKENFAQPIVSIMLSAITGGSIGIGVTTLPKTLMTPVLEIMNSEPLQSIPNPLKTELTALLQGLVTAVSAWATPVAMTLAFVSKGMNLSQFNKDAARSFVITLATFLTNPGFDQLLLSRFDKAISAGLISKDLVDRYMATIKIGLLMNGLALLYKTEYGGITGKELKAFFDGSFDVTNDEYSSLIVKLILEQLQKVPVEDKTALFTTLFASYDKTASYRWVESEPITTFVSLWDPKAFEYLPDFSKA